jgi:polysaccharide deacetylase family protein (PEP-CTERM system associated)
MPDAFPQECSEPKCIFTIDVEDWFHILNLPSTPPLSEWDRLPSRVDRNFLGLLDLLSEYGAQATCFFLGWVAERFPHLVREASSRGHEIASHGYAHKLVFHMQRDEFREDALRARGILEQISGAPVLGYRAAGFSVIEGTSWFFRELECAGYAYDSSVFPATRGHGGFHSASRAPHRVSGTERLVEFPVSVADTFGKPLCFFGGGYLRLFPTWLILKKSREVLCEHRPVVFYVHPREIDPGHPRLPMNLRRRFKSYVNLTQTEDKLRKILMAFPMMTFAEYLKQTKAQLAHVSDDAYVASAV